MTDFITQMFYDQGHFDAVENIEPFFSKPIWSILYHQTRTPDDRTRILNSKSFNGSTNPSIVAGIYAVPDKWMEPDDMPAKDRLIAFKTRYCRFAHNGSQRPLDAYRGLGSVWWNIMWCDAAREIGFDVTPTIRANDWDWSKKNSKTIEAIFGPSRQAFMRALNERLAASEIDILGQGGEFIILNQAVVDWEATRTASGFETAHKRRITAIKAMMNSAYEDFRALILSLRAGGDQIAMAQFKLLASTKTIVMTNIIMREPTQMRFMKSAIEIADRHGLKLALTADPFDSGTKKPADYGFTVARAGYLFQD